MIRVCLIGAGRMGLRHVEAIKMLGYELQGVFDISEKSANQALAVFSGNGAKFYSDPEIMLDVVKPDAVVISTTAPFHHEYVMLCSKKNVPYVLSEKPLCSSAIQMNEMLDACENSNTKLAVNHQMMFLPQYTEVKRLISELEFGRVNSVIVAAANFGLAMNASHYFEMFRYITDEHLSTVQAWLESEKLENPRGVQFEDRSGRVVGFSESGKSLYMDFSVNSGHGVQCTYICRNGQITVDELAGDLRYTVRKPAHHAESTNRYGMPADIVTVKIPAVDIVDSTAKVLESLIAGQDYPSADTCGRHAMQCVFASHISDESSNKVVSLDEMNFDEGRIFPWA
jgi:predicted dehydrogenase